MKKIFKIIICTIVCMALLLVPMTVMAEEGVTYNISATTLTEGTNTYTLDGTVPYTVFKLHPTAVGDFTITSSDCVMGIVSYHDMWVQFEPTDEIVNLNEINWSCTDTNQSIMIGVKADTSDVSITVTRKESIVVEIPWDIYENIATPEKFEMPDFVDLEALENGYVDFEDSVIDEAVLGDDGYYHLNEKNGPILFANLNDPIMSLYDMSGYGRVAAIYYDNGEVIKKVDYTDAFNEYIAALPTNAGGIISSYYYPLTADLIEMFKEIGATHDWYSGDNAWIYDSEDAWLYACYYDENVTIMDPSAYENSTNIGGNTNTGNNQNGNNTNDTTNENTNIDTSNKAPATGDINLVTTAMSVVMIAVVFGLNAKKVTE
ncbi:MAG: hypothetical protein IKU82_00750 [Clostridia bacterium]|nr:hypothetical protein [Clostridia bacterium]